MKIYPKKATLLINHSRRLMMQQYYHFNYEERVKIQLLAKKDFTLRKIASMLGRSPSSTSI
jgi:hypothetical protein